MQGLSISGGSTKIAALAGAANTLCQKYNYKPDVISGISAGSILAVPLAMGMYSEIEKYSTNFTLCSIFDVPPVTKSGKISLIGKIRALLGKESLGRQEALIKTLRKILPPQKFEEYKNGNYAICYLGSVDFKTGQRRYVNVKEVDYDHYLHIVLASTSIPVFVEGVRIDGGYWYDGGVRDHIGSHWLIEKVPMERHVSIYSRPEDYNIADANWKPKSVVDVLTRTLEIMNTEISKNDEMREDSLAEIFNVQNTKFFMPYILSTGNYETTPEKLKEWYAIGCSVVNKYYNT